MRILITRLSAHGDIIQTLPLLNTLRTLFPDAFIGWLVEPAGVPLLADHPQLNAIHVLPLKAMRAQLKQGDVVGCLREGRTALADIHRQRYDVSLDPQGLLKSALVPWLLRIPKRVGFDRTREQAAFCYTHRMPPHQMTDPHRPAMDWFNSLAAALTDKPLPPPAYVLPPSSPQLEASMADALSSLPRPIVALAPGTIWSSKQWPHWPALFADLADHNVVILGSPAEADIVNHWIQSVFNGRLPIHWQNWTGQTDWPGLNALLRLVDVLIGPDSAPLHLADAISAQTGRPSIIGLYGPTAPGRTGPVGAIHQTLHTALPCQPCFKRVCPKQGMEHKACLTGLSPSAVLQTLREMTQ